MNRASVSVMSTKAVAVLLLLIGCGGGDELDQAQDEIFSRNPSVPLLSVTWKTDTSVKLRLVDRSHVEAGFRIEMHGTFRGWTLAELYPALAGNHASADIVVEGLNPRTRYCFRAVAYGVSGDAISAVACTHTPATSCDGAKLDKVVEPFSGSVAVDCDLSLEPHNNIAKNLIYAGSSASNTVLDLNGATVLGSIQIMSVELEPVGSNLSTYDRPENITIKNGELRGPIRIWGMARNGEGNDESPYGNMLKRSSRMLGHTERAQAAAPTNITLDNLIVSGTGGNPVYFAPGVTHSRLLNSEIRGGSTRVGLYLDAESSGNTIKGNVFSIETTATPGGLKNPQIAIDGSANNKIVNNLFVDADYGAIQLYRNCGDNGVVRHQTPSNNHIINNRFEYVDDAFDWDSLLDTQPAVLIGARDWNQETRYCHEDNDVDFGSGQGDADYATYNVVMQNQIYDFAVSEMIVTQNHAANSPNFIGLNESVTAETAVIGRPAGCWVDETVGFLLDGESYEAIPSRGGLYLVTCQNGEL